MYVRMRASEQAPVNVCVDVGGCGRRKEEKEEGDRGHRRFTGSPTDSGLLSRRLVWPDSSFLRWDICH